MKLGKYDITSKNVWAYIQGNTRMIMDTHGPDIFKSPQYIQEQVIWREVIHNQECYKAGECLYPLDRPCHCKVPDKLYSDKECEGGCYPAIMDEYTWGRFKQLCARRNINIFADKFDWDVIIADCHNMDRMFFSSLMDNDEAINNLGQCPVGVMLHGEFKIFNPDKESLVINTIAPSCPCVQCIIPNPIGSNEYGIIKFTVDTEGKKFGDNEIWLTIRYNEINRINLKIQFNIIRNG